MICSLPVVVGFDKNSSCSKNYVVWHLFNHFTAVISPIPALHSPRPFAFLRLDFGSNRDE